MDLCLEDQQNKDKKELNIFRNLSGGYKKNLLAVTLGFILHKVL